MLPRAIAETTQPERQSNSRRSRRPIGSHLSRSVTTLGGSLVKTSIPFAVLYFWGAAYYDSYLTGLGFREGAPRLDTAAYLIASWRALASASITGLQGMLLVVFAAFITNVWSALDGFRVASRSRKAETPAADHGTHSFALTVLRIQVERVGTHALRQLAAFAGVAVALLVALHETAAMTKYGHEAAVATLETCRDASITFESSIPEQLKYCTRLGDQIVLRDDTVSILVDASKVVRIALRARTQAGQVGGGRHTIVDREKRRP